MKIASSTVTDGKDDSMAAVVSSLPLPPKTVKPFPQRNVPASCTVGGTTMSVQALSPLISTPLLNAATAAATAAVAAPCNSGSSSNHSFLTLYHFPKEN